MENLKISEAVKKLEGLTYSDWVKIRTAIDRNFEIKISELKRNIQLTDSEKIKELIQSQFG